MITVKEENRGTYFIKNSVNAELEKGYGDKSEYQSVYGA